MSFVKPSFSIPPGMLQHLRSAAEARGVSTSEIVREALASVGYGRTPVAPESHPGPTPVAPPPVLPRSHPGRTTVAPGSHRGGDYRGGGVEVGVPPEEEQTPEQNTPPPPSSRRKAKASVPAHLEDATADNPPLPDRLAPFADAWRVFLEYRQHRKKPPVTVYGARSLLKQFEKYPPEAFRVAIEAAMANSWQGLIFDDGPAGWSGAASRPRPVTPGSDESRRQRAAELDRELGLTGGAS